MNLKEWEGKKIFKQYGINVPSSQLIKKPADIKLKYPWLVLKAQIPVGRRKKRGLIRICERKDAKEVAAEILGKTVKGEKIEEILVEERMDIENELYLSLLIDSMQIKCLYSELGGIEVEKLIRRHPEKLLEFSPHKLMEKKLPDPCVLLVKKLLRLMQDFDAELVEINPLAKTPKGYVALDSKIVLDDSSLWRQPFNYRGEDVERKARKAGINFVKLDGDIGVIGNGAGLAMLTLDLLEKRGLKPSCFLDVSGKATGESILKALKIASSQSKLILVNFFGEFMRCDEVARSIVRFSGTPVYAALEGNGAKKGRKILSKAGIKCYSRINKAIKEIENVYSRRF